MSWSPPGEAPFRDGHYGGPRRAVRPETTAEREFCALGPVAEAFITGPAAARNTRLTGRRPSWPRCARAWRGGLRQALDRGVAFSRWRSADVRSVLAARDH
jgi:hypothetical protein